jgi:predicted PurR-regulated permease PerM
MLLAVIGLILLGAYSLRQVLWPFIIAAIAAYALDPWVQRLESMRIQRHWASLWVMLFGLVCILGVFFIVIPVFIKQYELVLNSIPKLSAYIREKLEHPWVRTYLSSDATFDPAMLQKAGRWLWVWLRGQANFLGIIILLPFLLYYFLLGWDQSIDRARQLIPPRFRPMIATFLKDIDQSLAAYVRGQLIVMMAMALFYGFSLWLMGVPSGFAIGIVTGLLVFVPYLGVAFGLIMAVLVTLLHAPSWFDVVWRVLPVFGLGQLLESFWLTPKFVGSYIGLSPIAILFALMVFGQWFGFPGLMLALPLAAVCDVVLRHLFQAYKASAIYLKP